MEVNPVEENVYKAVFENSATAIAVLESDFLITLVNEAFCDLSGYSKDELIGSKWTSKMPEDEVERLKKYNIARYQNHQFFPNEYESAYFRKTGELRYCIISASILKESKKTIVTIIDITNIKETERKLTQKEDRYRSLVEYANDVVYSVSDEGNFKYVSPNWTEKLGHSLHEVIGNPIKKFIHPEDYPGFRDIALQILKAGDKVPDVEYRFRSKKGEWIWYETSFSSTIDREEESKMIIGIAHDITKRKLAEHASHDNRAKLDIALKIGQLGPWEFDVKENLFYFNDTFYSLYRTNTKTVGSNTLNPDKYTKIFVHPDDALCIKKEIQCAIETKNPNYTKQIEHRMLYADGEVGFLAVRISIEKDRKGKTIKIYGINQDITAFKKNEEELRFGRNQLQELNAKKDKFFSILAHDLINPISSIAGISDFLVNFAHTEQSEELLEIAELIQQSSKQVMNLLSNLLEWSRAETGHIKIKSQEFDINQTIKEVVDLFSLTASQKSIELKMIHSEVLLAYTDKSMVSTVLRNLISNAIKFSVPQSVVYITAERYKNDIIVKVRDNGIGMSEVAIQNLFRIDVHHSTRGTENEVGTGLGLILCKEFVEKLGGEIWVKSELNKGSEFYFTIPAIKQ